MNEVKFKVNKKDLEAIGGEIQKATAALDTTDATAGQVLKVLTPGKAPVWGEAGGGGGGVAVFDVPVSTNLPSFVYESVSFDNLNFSFSDVIDAIESGKSVVFRLIYGTVGSNNYSVDYAYLYQRFRETNVNRFYAFTSFEEVASTSAYVSLKRLFVSTSSPTQISVRGITYKIALSA